MTTSGRLLVMVAAGALLLAGCGSGTTDTPAESTTTGESAGTSTETTPAADEIIGTVTVLAAASLTEAFTELADQLMAEHPGITVELSFGSSTTLAQQISEGAEADVYASAGRGALEQMPADFAADGDSVEIASNLLEIAVPQGNPGNVNSLEDFTRSDIDTVLCESSVPCGRAADEAFAMAGLNPTPVSREIDVKATLSKVELGEADAAIVYQSDVFTARDAVEGIEIPLDTNAAIVYPMLWSNTEATTLAFIDLVRGPEGLAALGEAGFGPP